MIGFSWPAPTDRPLRLLVIGCHSDDAEIGCGATLLQLVADRPEMEVHWAVLTGSGTRADEARASASDFLTGLTTAPRLIMPGLRDGFLPHEGAATKEVFETLLKPIAPDLVLTHFRADLHQDHRLAAELTWNTFRDHAILEYEIPKFDGDLGVPNVFVPVSEQILERKIELLMRHFGTQRSKRWFTPELFRALPRIRGMECQAPSGYAEAFHGRKVLLVSGTTPT